MVGRQPPLTNIRTPISPPHLMAVAQALADKLRGTPMGPLAEALSKVCYLQEVFNRSQLAQYSSAPGPHSASHLPNSTRDPLATDIAPGLGDANTEGVSNAFRRADAQDKRDIKVSVEGTVIGIRNKLNYTTTVAVPTDNPGTDSIDLPRDSAEESEVFAFFIARGVWAG